ncbi:hypothetical protein Vadar_014957 [Vaccinium darrowii]|uniref:Uncharacterized protein n=1 Tax=Vaccinium darrowii TaxID=229202 RepID=A0ACB7Y7Z1_9ERIC|nr:hypothetical protein Vadar_014957 [Vaccinium darrowii]
MPNSGHFNVTTDSTPLLTNARRDLKAIPTTKGQSIHETSNRPLSVGSRISVQRSHPKLYIRLAMEPNPDPEHHLMIDHRMPQAIEIDPKRGPNFVCVDNFTFGAVARYIQISKEMCCICPHLAAYRRDETSRDLLTWDDALRKGTQEFQHRSYNLFTCNCHSFVANNLNRLAFQSGGWNVVNVAALIFLKGQWVNKASMVRSYLPFVVVFSLGLTIGGWTFTTFLAFFTFLLVGWFLLGTYCFRNLILL